MENGLRQRELKVNDNYKFGRRKKVSAEDWEGRFWWREKNGERKEREPTPERLRTNIKVDLY